MSQIKDVAMAAIQQQQRLSDILYDALILLAPHNLKAATSLVARFQDAVHSNSADFEIIQSGAGIPRE